MVPVSQLRIAEQAVADSADETKRAFARLSEVEVRLSVVVRDYEAKLTMADNDLASAVDKFKPLKAEVKMLTGEVAKLAEDKKKVVHDLAVERQQRMVAEQGLALSRDNERKVILQLAEVRRELEQLSSDVEMWRQRENLSCVKANEAEAKLASAEAEALKKAVAAEERAQLAVAAAEEKTRNVVTRLNAVRDTLATGGLSEGSGLDALCKAMGGQGGEDIVQLLLAISRVEGGSVKELCAVVNGFAECRRQPLSSISHVGAALRTGTAERTWAEGARLIQVLNVGSPLSEADLRAIREAIGALTVSEVTQILAQCESLQSILDLKKLVARQTNEIIALKLSACAKPEDHFKLDAMAHEIESMTIAMERVLSPAPPKFLPTTRKAKGSLVVKMVASDSSHSVFFTTDGSEPSPTNFADHSLGSASIRITESSVIRACVVGIGGRASASREERYELSCMDGGLGILISPGGPQEHPRVRGMLAGGAADRDGTVREGDLVVSIDGVDAAGLSVDEVSRMTSGEIGSAAVLVLERADGSIVHSTIEREHMPLKLGTPTRARGSSASPTAAQMVCLTSDHRPTEQSLSPSIHPSMGT